MSSLWIDEVSMLLFFVTVGAIIAGVVAILLVVVPYPSDED